MIKFISLTFRNFLSFGNNETTIQLDKPGATLIIGEDLDNTVDGKRSNGVGKTAIINALTYAVYDKPISQISKDNLVNNINKKHMEVSVIFEKDGKTYNIKRARKMKAGAEGNTVHFYENGKDITVDSAGTNALIEKVMGISYDLFVRIVVFSASHTPFLDLPLTSHYAANQTDIIEGLFDLTTLSEKAVALKEMTKEIEQTINIKKVRIADLEEEHKRHEQQLESAKKRVIQWAQQNESTLSDLESKLELVRNINIEQQEVLLNQKDELEKKKQELEHIIKNEETTLTHINNQLREIKNKINSYTSIATGYKKDVQEKEKQKETLFNQIKHLEEGKCPMCLQAFPDASKKISELQKNTLVVEKDIKEKSTCLVNNNSEIGVSKEQEQKIKITKEEAETTISKYKRELEKYQQDIKTLNKELIVQTRDELYQLKNQETSLIDKIEECKNQENPFIEPLEELKNIKIDDINYDEVNELTKVVEHQKFLIKLLTKKDSFVRKVLLNKNIPYLNGRLQHYLSILGLPHVVEFTHEMAARITQFGRELDFGNLSTGQRARVNLALSFAFRDVLENLHTRINICMLDEVLDVGLDAIGVQSAARLLKRKARDEHISLFIISHRNEIGHSFDNAMTVQLSNGFSYIQEN